jgi:hypothetical protein
LGFFLYIIIQTRGFSLDKNSKKSKNKTFCHFAQATKIRFWKRVTETRKPPLYSGGSMLFFGNDIDVDPAAPVIFRASP